MKNIILIAGARPNFMKIASVIDAIKANPLIDYKLVHTGQHYDHKMSRNFFEQLNIPEPDVNLGAGGGTQAEQTASIMVRFEEYLSSNPTEMVVVVGDVTSTLACSIVAKKMNTAVAHIEGGLRSGDNLMPEEINRIVTDSISDYFFTTSENAGEILKKEGKDPERIFFVGNTMIDTLLKNIPKLKKPLFWDKMKLMPSSYFVLTLHRPSNVDDSGLLERVLFEIDTASENYPVVFPVHPRTKKILDSLNIRFNNINLCEPQGYLEFNFLVKHSKGVITDSGGITEETTVLGIPCITLRNSTERPETVTIGTNELIGTDPYSINPYVSKIISGQWKKGEIPALWDGNTGARIVEKIASL